jgi:histidine triad (HIT) family protein
VTAKRCVFCEIVHGERAESGVFFEDDVCLGLMDIAPLKPGHALLLPKPHYETIKDLPIELLQPLMLNAQRIARAVEIAFEADGSFSGYNTHVSQSVPHFHMHIVPRNFDDKLFSGGRWIRHPYASNDIAAGYRDKLKAAMDAQDRVVPSPD